VTALDLAVQNSRDIVSQKPKQYIMFSHWQIK
jgi:hypothetical protein